MFTVFVFGFVSAFRSLERARNIGFISSACLPKIGGVLFISISLVSALVLVSKTLTVLSMISFVVFALELPRIALWWHIRTFERHRIQLLSRVLLKMKTGVSLRAAFLGILAEEEQGNSVLVPILRALAEALELGQPSAAVAKHTSTLFFCKEVMSAEGSSHQSASRIQNLRALYQKQFDFRRRSGQVLMQIRAQTVVLCGLYFATFAFVTSSYGFYRYRFLEMGSAILFLLGLLLIIFLGRKVRWTV